MAIKYSKLMCDFETTTDPNDARVWAGAAVDIEKLEVAYIGKDIDSFMEFLKGKNTVCYFHNLRFDASYILYYLFKNNYKHVLSEDKQGRKIPLKDKTFRTLITDDGLFYSVEVCFKRHKSKKYEKVIFYDSLKKLPFKVSEIAKAFELKQSKGEIDYHAHRPIGYEMTEEEKEYILTDCEIVAEALKIQFAQGLTKMTNASDAMGSYKEIVGAKFEKWFPVLPIELDNDIRRAYKGGYVYLNPKYKGVRGLFGLTYDINSLYPWAMRNAGLLPYGYPMFFEGEYVQDKNYPLYITHLKCTFKVKENHLPTLQLKNNRRYIETEYLTTSEIEVAAGIYEDEPVEMWLTSVDFELFKDHYNIDNLTFINGYKFKGAKGCDLFGEYIDYWMSIKETTTGALRQLAKLMLNSLYGRFAMNPKTRKKIPYLDEEVDVVKFTYGDWEYRNPVYTAMGCFITAYARNKTVRSGQEVYHRFIYADTDSLSLIGYDEPDNLEIHPTHLGAWKNEGEFTDSYFVRAKTYLKTVNGKLKVTCAGMPDNVKESVTYDNFHSGSVFGGKKMPKMVSGGIILQEYTFTIK